MLRTVSFLFVTSLMVLTITSLQALTVNNACKPASGDDGVYADFTRELGLLTCPGIETKKLVFGKNSFTLDKKCHYILAPTRDKNGSPAGSETCSVSNDSTVKLEHVPGGCKCTPDEKDNAQVE